MQPASGITHAMNASTKKVSEMITAAIIPPQAAFYELFKLFKICFHLSYSFKNIYTGATRYIQNVLQQDL